MTTPSEPAASGASTPDQAAPTPVDPGAIQATLPPSSTGIQTEASPAGSERVALPPITAEPAKQTLWFAPACAASVPSQTTLMVPLTASWEVSQAKPVAGAAGVMELNEPA